MVKEVSRRGRNRGEDRREEKKKRELDNIKKE